MTTTDVSDRSRPRRSRLMLVLVLVAACMAALVPSLVGIAVMRDPGELATTPSVASSARPAASPTTGPESSATTIADPAAALQRLAADLANGPADPAKARFEYVETRVWESFGSLFSAAPGSRGPGRRIHLWTTGRGSYRVVTIDEARCPPERDESGGDLGPFDGPLSSDPDAVRRQILHEPLPADAVPDVFGQVADFYSARLVPLPTRQGVLRMLARLPGIGVHPAVTDSIGRTGVAVTWTYRPPMMSFVVEKTLVFDPSSGQLLASHSRGQRRLEATTPPDLGDAYEIYLLFLGSTYAPDTDTPKVACA